MRYEGMAIAGDGIDVGPQVSPPLTETRSPVMTQEEFLSHLEVMREDIVRHVETYCVVEADAEDAVQNAMVYCLEHRDHYDPEQASLKTWVTRKALWCACDINDGYERWSRSEGEPEDFDDTDDEGRPAECRQVLNVETGNPDCPKRARMKEWTKREQAYEPTDDLKMDLEKAFGSLRPAVRDAVKAVLMEGVTQREYAKETGLAKSTVDRLIQEGRQELKRRLSGYP